MNLKRKNKNEPLLDESVKALFSLYGQYKGRFITIDILRAVSSILGAFLPYFIAKLQRQTAMYTNWLSWYLQCLHLWLCMEFYGPEQTMCIH